MVGLNFKTTTNLAGLLAKLPSLHGSSNGNVCPNLFRIRELVPSDVSSVIPRNPALPVVIAFALLIDMLNRAGD